MSIKGEIWFEIFFDNPTDLKPKDCQQAWDVRRDLEVEFKNAGYIVVGVGMGRESMDLSVGHGDADEIAAFGKKLIESRGFRVECRHLEKKKNKTSGFWP